MTFVRTGLAFVSLVAYLPSAFAQGVVAGFDYVGPGTCQDATGNYYDHGQFFSVNSIAECGAKCSDPLYPALRGFVSCLDQAACSELYQVCWCYFEDGQLQTLNSPWNVISEIYSGTGPITQLSTESATWNNGVCYKVSVPVVAGYEYVGNGHCVDTSGAFYDYGLIQPVNTAAECGALCPSLPESRGFRFQLQAGGNVCHCLFEDNQIQNPVSGSYVSTNDGNSGTGPVATSGGSSTTSCYKVATVTGPAQYTVPDPVCTINDSSSTGSIGDVQCTFSNAQRGTTGSLSSTLLEFDDCSTPYAGGSAAVISGDAFTNGPNHIVNVDVTPPGGSADIKFCLKTVVTDGADGGGNEFMSQLQKITVTFVYDGGFTGVAIGSTQFAANVGTNVQTNTIGVVAKHCDGAGNEITSGTLSLGDVLNICIEPTTAGSATITTVDSMSAKKGTTLEYDIVDGNTVIQGLTSAKAVVSTRLPLSFFQDADPISVSGGATLADGRRLTVTARVLDEDTTDGNFEIDIEVEAVSSSSATVFVRASYSAAVGIALFLAAGF